MPTCQHETTPLLEGDNDSQNAQGQKPTKNNSLWYTVALSCGVVVLFNIAGYLEVPAQTAIFEKIVCEDYYSTALARYDQEICKIEVVQAEVALLSGLINTFQTIPGIFLGFLYGVLADKIGYKPIMILAILGCILSDLWVKIICWFHPVLPIRAVWFSFVFESIGGGPQVMTSMLFTTVAKVCPPTQRTSVFSKMTAIVLLSELIATPAGAALMVPDPWVPFWASTFLSVSSLILTLLIFPETLNIDKNLESNDSLPLLADQDQSAGRSMVERIHEEIKKLHEIRQWTQQNMNSMLLVFCSFVNVLDKQSLQIFIQYTSKKFHLSLTQASYFIPIRAGISLLVLIIVLPSVSGFLTERLGLAVRVKEKRLAQLNAGLLLLGSVVVFIAPSPIVLGLGMSLFGLGSSLPVTTRTFLTCLVDQKFLATAYAMIAVVTSIGMLIAGPLLASTFQLGMSGGELWIGFPFLVVAGMYLIVLVTVSSVRLPAEQ